MGAVAQGTFGEIEPSLYSAQPVGTSGHGDSEDVASAYAAQVGAVSLGRVVYACFRTGSSMTTTVHATVIGGNPAYYLEGRVPVNVQDVWGATFMKRSNRWVFPAFRPTHLRPIDDLQRVCARDKNPLIIADSVKALLRAHEAFLSLPDDFTFVTPPFQHQIDGLLWAYNLPRCGLLFDPGLGKSKITVDLHRLTGASMLILCPTVVLRNWRDEFRVHGSIDNVVVLEGSRKKKLALVAGAAESMPAALIATFETAAGLVQEISALPYGCIVLDESHRIKSPSSIRTRATWKLTEGRPRRVLLSGTPTLGNPFSVYPQFRALGHYFAPETYAKYCERYASFAAHNEHQVVGYKNMDQLNKRVNELCLRKRQEECLDLPELRVIDVPFDLSKSQKDAYNMLIEDQGDALGAAEGFAARAGVLTQLDGLERPHAYVWAPETVSRLNKLEQIVGGFINKTAMNLGLCNGCPELESCIEHGVRPYTPGCRVAKTREVVAEVFKDNARRDVCKDLLEDILASPDNKAIIWTRYIVELGTVEEIAKELKVDYVVVRGGMSTDAFENAKTRFNTDPNCRLYIGQVASGIGITLNAANYMVYYSLPWSHEHYVQSRARFYRIGQKRAVTVYRLLATGTTDYHKAAALDQKLEVEDMLTSADYTPYCPVHSAGMVGARGTCRCDGSVDRIVASLTVIP
jgi:hypothetical protein